MTFNAAKAQRLDTIIAGSLAGYPETKDGKAMFAYSLNLHFAWRSLLWRLPIAPNMEVLDVGTGFGILPFDLATQLPVSVTGADINPSYIETATDILSTLTALGEFVKGSKVTFEVADICHLPNQSDTFDVVIVREVYLYLAEPMMASNELFRVLKPGGLLCVEDNDDALYLTYPPPSSAMAQLHEAITKLQQSLGGDREVGRKLSTYLDTAGFHIEGVELMSETLHRLADPSEGEKSFVLAELRHAREKVITAGVMDAQTFDALFDEVANERPHPEFRTNGRVVVLARKPT